MTDKEILKASQKKSKEELRQWLAFRRRHSIVKAKKGKGSYTRKGRNKNS